jgi:hypothetical protein
MVVASIRRVIKLSHAKLAYLLWGNVLIVVVLVIMFRRKRNANVRNINHIIDDYAE